MTRATYPMSKAKDTEANTDLGSYRTQCCNATFHQEGRALYLCDKCRNDVTMEILLVYEALSYNAPENK